MVFNTNGLNHSARIFTGEEASFIALRYLGVGSSTATPLATENDVRTPIGSRKFFKKAFATANIATIRFEFLFGDNNGTWEEWAIAWETSGGDILVLDLFASSVVKSSSVTELVDVDITLSG